MPKVTETTEFAYFVNSVHGGMVYPEEIWCSSASWPERPRREHGHQAAAGRGLWQRISGYFRG